MRIKINKMMADIAVKGMTIEVLRDFNKNKRVLEKYALYVLTQMPEELAEAREYGIEYFQAVAVDCDRRRRDLHNEAISALSSMDSLTWSSAGLHIVNVSLHEVPREDVAEAIFAFCNIQQHAVC